MIRGYIRQLLNWASYRYGKYKYPSLYELSGSEKQWHATAKKKIIIPTLIACNNLTNGKNLTIELPIEKCRLTILKQSHFPLNLMTPKLRLAQFHTTA